jgi:hypothetical protein
MDETTEAIVTVASLVVVMAFGIWRSRKIAGYWTAEAMQERGRAARRLIIFVPSVAFVPLFIWLAFTRDPADGLSAVFFALVAYLARPNWMRHKSPGNSSAPNPNAPATHL